MGKWLSLLSTVTGIIKCIQCNYHCVCNYIKIYLKLISGQSGAVSVFSMQSKQKLVCFQAFNLCVSYPVVSIPQLSLILLSMFSFLVHLWKLWHKQSKKMFIAMFLDKLYCYFKYWKWEVFACWSGEKRIYACLFNVV